MLDELLDDALVATVVPELGTAAPVPPAEAGAGTALLGSARFPVPQGMAALVPGWVGLEGGVVSPEAEAIVKRVVQVLSGASGELNW